MYVGALTIFKNKKKLIGKKLEFCVPKKIDFKSRADNFKSDFADNHKIKKKTKH